MVICAVAVNVVYIRMPTAWRFSPKVFHYQAVNEQTILIACIGVSEANLIIALTIVV